MRSIISEFNFKKLKEESKDKKKSKEKEKTKRTKKREDGIEINSEELRTAYFLIQKSSSRKSMEEIFNSLREFLNNHELKEIGYRDYQIFPK